MPSGDIYTSKYRARGLRLHWEYSEADQSISDNTTTLHWELSGYGDKPGTYYVSSNFNIYVDGSNIYYSDKKVDLYVDTVIASGTHVVSHTSDGTKSIDIRVTGGVYEWSLTNVEGSGSVTLNRIPRKATIVSAPNFTDADSPTVTYSNLAGNSVESLMLGILTPDLTSPDNYAIVPYREVSKTSSSYTFEFTESERLAIQAYCANTPSAQVAFVLRTVIGGVKYWSSLIRDVSIVNANPVIQPVIIDINEATVAATGNNRKLIANASIAEFNMYASAAKGATLKNVWVECDGKYIYEQTGRYDRPTSGKFTFYAVDSRGYETKKVVNVPIYEYAAPTINFTECVMAPDGTLTVNYAGQYFPTNFGAKHNAPKIELSYYAVGGSSSGWVDITDTFETGGYPNTYVGTKIIPGLKYNLTYRLSIRIIDLLSQAEAPTKEVSTVPLYGVGNSLFSIFASHLSGPLISLGAIPSFCEILPGDDLNDYRDPGTYVITRSENAPKITNCPSSNAGKLFVNASTGQVIDGGIWQNVQQIYVTFSRNIYIRYGTTSTVPGEWRWHSWKIVALSAV